MKITHESGNELYLPPGLQLEFERTNPFFVGYGERTLPATLPPVDENRRLLVYPDDIAGITKMSQRSDAMIQQGVFSIPCRQAILSANKRTGIETSFYLNLGAFYEKTKDVELSTIFKDKVISFNSVDDAIRFCRNLFITYDSRFACFEANIDTGTLNRLNFSSSDGNPRLYNDEPRVQVVNEKNIDLDPGYYITPFIRTIHLLEEIFAYFGYTLADSFFSQTEPFRSMVFLNDTMDTLMKSEIRYSQIVPDCNVSTILDVFRYRFCCEFIPDEANRIIHIVLFNELLEQNANKDLSSMVVDYYTVDHPEVFKQLKISSGRLSAQASREKDTSRYSSVPDYITEDLSQESGTLIEILKKYPDAEYIPYSGEFIRTGYKGTTLVRQRVGYVTMDYLDDGELTKEAKECPDVSPLMSYSGPLSSNRPGPGNNSSLSIYIGKGRALNSAIELKTVDSDSQEIEDNNTGTELSPMLCFVGRISTNLFDFGTIQNYDVSRNKLWNYTLAFHGSDGLFERFWRKFDDMLRNSFLEVKANLLLDDVDKVNLSEHHKVIIDGQELLPKIIKYVPESFVIRESTFLTTKLYEPISSATLEASRIDNLQSPYFWEVNYSRSNESDPYRKRFIFKNEPSVIYYAPPTQAQYNAGGRYHQRTYEVQFYRLSSESGPVDPIDGILTVWLEARLK